MNGEKERPRWIWSGLGEAGAWPIASRCGETEPEWLAWARREAELSSASAGSGGDARGGGSDGVEGLRGPGRWETRLRRLRRQARALAAAARTGLKDRLNDRAELLGSSIFLAVILIIFTRLWTVLAGGTGRVGEFSVAQLTCYLLITELVTLAPGPAHLRIGEEIRSGAFSVSLLRPVAFGWWELARALGGSGARLLALALSGVLVIAALTGLPALDPRGLALGLLLLLPAALVLELCARVLMGLLAFWVEDSAPFWWIWQKLAFVLGGLFLPLDFYPGWLQRVAACLPFRAVLYGPARTIVAFDPAEARVAAAGLAGWGLVFLTLLFVVESLGRRRTQVNGG